MPRASEPPKLDAVLDDPVWAQAPMPTGQWVSYNPNRGDKMPDVCKTDVRIAYDDRNLYFAFHWFDNEPGKIRTNIAKRDAAFSDDWIALSLDSAGTGQAAYHLFSNPSASQMDALNTSASGEQSRPPRRTSRSAAGASYVAQGLRPAGSPKINDCAKQQCRSEERTEGGRNVRKNVGGVAPRFTLRAAGRVFRCKIDTGVTGTRSV